MPCYRLSETVGKRLSRGSPGAGPISAAAPAAAAASPQSCAATPASQAAAPVALPGASARRPLPEPPGGSLARNPAHERRAVRDAAAASGDDGNGVPADGGERHARPVPAAEAAQRRLLNGVFIYTSYSAGRQKAKNVSPS